MTECLFVDDDCDDINDSLSFLLSIFLSALLIYVYLTFRNLAEQNIIRYKYMCMYSDGGKWMKRAVIYEKCLVDGCK
jgi:hypothetical protein